MANFIESFNRTLQAEGGYSNLSSDRGGRTYKGISEKNFPDWEGWIIVNSHEPMKRGEVIISDQLNDMVRRFYEKNFWIPLRLTEIRVQSVADELFDTAVNMGVGTAGKMLQRAMNLLNKNQKSYSDLVVDGQVGSDTMYAVNTFTNLDVNVSSLLKTLNGLQFMRYVDICEKDLSQEDNFIGWLKRV